MDRSPLLRVWCGHVTPDGKSYISLWNALNGFEICKVNITGNPIICSFEQRQHIVLVASQQKIFAFKLIPKFVAQWRIVSEPEAIDKIHTIDSDVNNLWIILNNSSVIKIWETVVKPNGIILMDPDICITHRGRVNCVKQIKYKPQNLQTIWSLVSENSQNHSIIIRNSTTMSVLQEIKLPEDKGGTSLSPIDDYVLVATSSEQTQSSTIVCFGFAL